MLFTRLTCLIILQFISIALFANNDLVSYCEEAPLIDHLNSINKEWNKQKDIPTDLLTIPMKFKTDEERIQLHLQLVSSILNKRSSDHLTVQQFTNRKKNLVSLVEYWNEGKFPINTRHSHRQPYFIDDYGTACAVGHLLLTNGGEQLAQHISNVQNYAYIHEINYTELDEWAVENGFTEDELAWIQPGYSGGKYCYTVYDINVPLNSEANQPLSQQEIKIMKTLPDESMMIVGGSFLHYDLMNGGHMASIFGYDGSTYTSFGDAIQGTVYDVEYYNGQIYAAGDFVLSGTNFYNIAYWNGTQWIGIQTGNMNGIIRDIESYGCQLYVGGDFATINGGSMANLAIWDGTAWSIAPQNCNQQTAAQNLEVNAPVNTFAVYDNKLAIGGAFTQLNATSVEGLIFLDDLTMEFPSTNGDITSVDNLETFESTLMVGADSLYAYFENTWHYPSDTVWQPIFFYDAYWVMPEMGRTDDIFYSPFYSLFGYPSNLMNHLIVIKDNEAFGINSTEGGISYGGETDFELVANGNFSTATRLQGITYLGGNFEAVGIESNPSERNDCDAGYTISKMFAMESILLLPIELAEFTVKSDDNKTAQLAWTSLTENNSLHYEIERRTDSEDFVYVSTVAAAGESLEEINYTYEDDISKTDGNYVYYRLKMVDKDGSYEYSDVRSLKLETRDSGISIAPNPAVNTIELSMKMGIGGDVNVHIYDMQGRQLCDYQWTYNDNSIVRERINVGHLETGLYLVEVISSHERKTMKLDVLR